MPARSPVPDEPADRIGRFCRAARVRFGKRILAATGARADHLLRNKTLTNAGMIQ